MDNGAHSRLGGSWAVFQQSHLCAHVTLLDDLQQILKLHQPQQPHDPNLGQKWKARSKAFLRLQLVYGWSLVTLQVPRYTGQKSFMRIPLQEDTTRRSQQAKSPRAPRARLVRQRPWRCLGGILKPWISRQRNKAPQTPVFVTPRLHLTCRTRPILRNAKLLCEVVLPSSTSMTCSTTCHHTPIYLPCS